MVERPIPVAVIGAGNMGSNHIRVYDEIGGADLTAVVEPDQNRASEVQSEYDVPVYEDVTELSEVAAASVAAPDVLHEKIAIECFKKGIDTLIEKPIAPTIDEAETIVEAAEASDAVLLVGHIERYNPVIEALEEYLADLNVIAFDVHRLGPFSEQLTSANVIFDMMIHDIDVVRHLMPGEVARLNAIGRRVRSDTFDHVICQLELRNGIVGSLTASHVTHDKVRELTICTEEAYINIDYFKQDMSIKRWGATDPVAVGTHSGYRTESILESPFIKNREPLKIEIEHFLECVRNRARPRTGGRAGLEAVRLARQIESEL